MRGVTSRVVSSRMLKYDTGMTDSECIKYLRNEGFNKYGKIFVEMVNHNVWFKNIRRDRVNYVFRKSMRRIKNDS